MPASCPSLLQTDLESALRGEVDVARVAVSIVQKIASTFRSALKPLLVSPSRDLRVIAT